MDAMGGGPPAARAVLVVMFTVLAVFYAARATDVCLSAHAPHLLMSVGMLYMALPVTWQLLPLASWVAIFGAASGWCVVRTRRRWQRDHHLDVDFAHSELAGCVAMTAMLPLFTIAALDGAALPLSIALGTYFLAYTVFWTWRVCGGGAALLGLTRTPAEAVAQMAMGAGMAYMFLVM